tara:strand:- start:3384 stop:3509 length:126 start_codon:yes stop_codon:yes gene_type:complete
LIRVFSHNSIVVPIDSEPIFNGWRFDNPISVQTLSNNGGFP